MALIQQYESIDNLYAKMPDIEAKPAAIRKLAEGEESAGNLTGWPPSLPTRLWTSIPRRTCAGSPARTPTRCF